MLGRAKKCDSREDDVSHTETDNGSLTGSEKDKNVIEKYDSERGPNERGIYNNYGKCQRDIDQTNNERLLCDKRSKGEQRCEEDGPRVGWFEDKSEQNDRLRIET